MFISGTGQDLRKCEIVETIGHLFKCLKWSMYVYVTLTWWTTYGIPSPSNCDHWS